MALRLRPGHRGAPQSGSLYPILVRLADRGLPETSWEPSVDSRPPRHLCRLTGAGREFVAAVTAARRDPSAAPIGV